MAYPSRAYFIFIIFAYSIQSGITQPYYKQDTTLQTSNHGPCLASVILPGSWIALGAYSIHHTTILDRYGVKNWRDKNFPNFHTNTDDVLQYIPMVAGFGLGLTNQHDKLWLYTKRVILSEIISNIVVQTIKSKSHILRPNQDGYSSFPSGHTTQAFVSATLFADQFAQGKPWLQVISYSMATSVGILRVLNDKHWLNDVIAGAGFGILSAKVSEMIFKDRAPKH